MAESKVLTETELNTISDKLVSARRQKLSLDRFPGPVPQTLAQAYQIQDKSITCYQDEIIGWKVGVVPEHLRDTYQAERLMGPVHKSLCHFLTGDQEDNEYLEVPVYGEGFAAVEAELIFELASDIEPGTINTDQDLTHFISQVYAGVEIASSPVPDLNAYGPTAIISDFGNNNGMIVGKAIDNWQQRLAAIDTQVVIDGKMINQAPADAVLNGPMAAIAYLIDCCAERGITLKQGAFICTGAITGVHEAGVGAQSIVSFGDFERIQLKFVDFV